MLDRLRPKHGSRRPRLRVGRGVGSGLGKTSGRGQKGDGARTGTVHKAQYEGGQMPMARRLPKRGFTNLFREPFQVVNVKALGAFDPGAGDDRRAAPARPAEIGGVQTADVDVGAARLGKPPVPAGPQAGDAPLELGAIDRRQRHRRAGQ